MLEKPECLRAFYEGLDTIDAIMVAAEYSHGKRAGVVSDNGFRLSGKMPNCHP
ncbi:MAG: hypothetical protein ABSB26_04560 [Nitrososphaerales archaeon]|jgi:hypothetical protein